MFAAVLAVIYALVAIGRYWFGAVIPAAEISRSARALPLYAFIRLVRMRPGLSAEPGFRSGLRYIAALTAIVWQGVMLAALDILQSIPVLSFFPA